TPPPPFLLPSLSLTSSLLHFVSLPVVPSSLLHGQIQWHGAEEDPAAVQARIRRSGRRILRRKARRRVASLSPHRIWWWAASQLLRTGAHPRATMDWDHSRLE
ncbi:hypothetical protein EJB05_37458, partial [Eragrostis curvula]